MGECKGVYSVLVGNMRERDHFGDPGVDGMDLQEVGCGDVDWMELASWEAMHRWQRLVHPSKQFWKWFCGMAFRAAVVLLLMSSLSSKCFLSIFPSSSGTEKSHWGLDPVNRQGVPTQSFV